MNNAVVFNKKHKSSQREPKDKTLSSLEIYNPSPFLRVEVSLRICHCLWRVTTKKKEAFLVSLVIPKRIKSMTPVSC